MNIIAIRGATTIGKNTKEEILQRTKELISNVIAENNLQVSQIISITFTATRDITKVYPAVAARDLGITQAALMCMQEMYVEGSLPMCIRIMMLAHHNNTDIKHIYLHEAKKLRPDLVRKVSIAIDGPAGAGKSTIAKDIAKQLDYIYIDTGAMYRAVAYHCKHEGIDWHDEQKVVTALENIDIKIISNHEIGQIYLNNEDVTSLIRTQEIASGASVVAAYENVRKKLVQLQQGLALENSVVMDGRDIGTHVLPGADLKIFLTASVLERANRRVGELTKRGLHASLEKVKQEILKRDYDDSNREFSPLRKAFDAIEVDTTDKSIPKVVSEILEFVEKL